MIVGALNILMSAALFNVAERMMVDLHQDDLLDSLPGMAYQRYHDTRRTLLFSSKGCLELTGYTATELMEGIAFGHLIHAEDQAMVERQIEEAVQAKRPYHCIYRLIAAGGQERWVWDKGRGVFATDGELLALEGFVTDASEQISRLKQVEQQLADETRKLSALHEILEAVSVPAELPSILEKSLQAALIAAQGDAGFIHLRERSGKSMRLVAQQEIYDSVSKSIASVSMEDGLMAWVARNRRAMLISDIGEDPRTVYLKGSGSLKVYVGVPISRGQRVWGTLSVLGKDPAQFTGEEVALLSSIGEEIGVVMENARLRRQADELLLVQERNRLARELHDSVTQSLYSITLFAEAGRRIASADQDEEAAGYFSQIGETGQQALKEMRLLVHRLRPSILTQEGLVRALQQRMNSVEGRAGVKSRLVVEGEPKLSQPLEDAIYQIAQEALNNSLKHAMASEVIVRLDFTGSEQAVLRVEDNGRGFDPKTAGESDGMGLTSMRERAESFGGELSIQSTPGQGSMIEARLRYSASPPKQQLEFGVEDLHE